MSKVSVVIPVFNTAPWLEECLDSVIHQTFTDIEIICVNDASTDNSKDILKTYAKNDNRIRIIEFEKNYGQSHARNIGMETAKSDYIYFLDSDDFIDHKAIEEMYRLSAINALDILYFDAEPVIDDDLFKRNYSTYLFHRSGKEYGEKIYKGIDLLNIFLKNDDWTCSMPRHFFKREFLKKNGFSFSEGRIHEDELFAFQCAIMAERAMFVPDVFFYRRFREGSTMTKHESVKNLIGYFSAVWYMSKMANEKGAYTEQVRSYIARISNRVVMLYEKFNKDIPGEIEKLNDRELKNAFYFFKTQQDAYYAYGGLSDALMEQIRHYDSVYIYGAGTVAKSVFKGIVKKDIPISGFVVTDLENNPQSLEGQRVLSFEKFLSISEKEKSIIILAVKYNTQEIQNKLTDKGYTNYMYNYDDKAVKQV